MSDEGLITLEEHNNSLRSPQLQPSRLNFDSADTPPPLVDDPSSDHSDCDTDRQVYRRRSSCDFQARIQSFRHTDRSAPKLDTLCESELVETTRAELLCSISGIASLGRRPRAPHDQDQMTGVQYSTEEFIVSQHSRELAVKALQASKTFNAAIGQNQYDSRYEKHSFYPPNSLRHDVKQDIRRASYRDADHKSNDLPPAQLPNGHENCPGFSSTRPSLHSPKTLDVKPPPRPTLPALHTQSPTSRDEWASEATDLTASSPSLAKFAITPLDGHPSQTLPKLHNPSPTRTFFSNSSEARQTLPSLETALNSATDSNGTPYPDPSPALTLPPPSQKSQFGPSPSSYSHASPSSAMSPPRLPTHPSYWRTTSQNSASTPSDYASTSASVAVSTPASSVPGLSPAESMHTPGAMGPDSEFQNERDMEGAQAVDESGQFVGFSNQIYKCSYPGCNAAPFQTQYLLNSHANVHSNTRPHFCPVKSCPRGPGGQGFKRKNEMIRHGLVHQSPGYVCPFCPDQQHKYPRPDNLQRHVRVHHVDRDRDDPELREVLAQRTEGGNRGRRRRLGS